MSTAALVALNVTLAMILGFVVLPAIVDYGEKRGWWW